MEVAKQVERYGEDLSLFCRVDNCCPESAGWIKWTSENEFSTIFIDVKHLIVDESSKYDGGTNERGFFLDIRKITRQDLNMKYSCTYGFEKSEKQLLLKTDVFFVKKKPVNATGINDSKSGNTETGIPPSEVYKLVIVASCLVVVSIVVVVITTIWFQCKKTGQHKQPVTPNHTLPGTTTGEPEKEELLGKSTHTDLHIHHVSLSKSAPEQYMREEGKEDRVESSNTADPHIHHVSLSKSAPEQYMREEGKEGRVENSNTAGQHKQPVSPNYTLPGTSISEPEKEALLEKSTTTVLYQRNEYTNHVIQNMSGTESKSSNRRNSI